MSEITLTSQFGKTLIVKRGHNYEFGGDCVSFRAFAPHDDGWRREQTNITISEARILQSWLHETLGTQDLYFVRAVYGSNDARPTGSKFTYRADSAEDAVSQWHGEHPAANAPLGFLVRNERCSNSVLIPA